MVMGKLPGLEKEGREMRGKRRGGGKRRRPEEPAGQRRQRRESNDILLVIHLNKAPLQPLSFPRNSVVATSGPAHSKLPWLLWDTEDLVRPSRTRQQADTHPLGAVFTGLESSAELSLS